MRTSSLTSAMVAAFILLPAAAMAQSSAPRGSEGFSARGFVQNSPSLERATERVGPPRIYNDVPIRAPGLPQRVTSPNNPPRCGMPAPRPKASSYCTQICRDRNTGPEGICVQWKLLY